MLRLEGKSAIGIHSQAPQPSPGSTFFPPSASLATNLSMDHLDSLVTDQDDEGGDRTSPDQEQPMASSGPFDIDDIEDDGTTGDADEPVGKRRKLTEESGGGDTDGSPSFLSDEAHIDAAGPSSSWVDQGVSAALNPLPGVQGGLPAPTPLSTLQSQKLQPQQHFQSPIGRTSSQFSGGGPSALSVPVASMPGLQGMGMRSNSSLSAGNAENNSIFPHSMPAASAATLQQRWMQNQAMMMATNTPGMLNMPYGNAPVSHQVSAPTNYAQSASGMVISPQVYQQMMFHNQLAAYGMTPQGMVGPIQSLQQQSANLMVPAVMLPQPSALGGGTVAGPTDRAAYSMGSPKTTAGKTHAAASANLKSADDATTTPEDNSNLTGRRPMPVFMSCDEESLSEYQCLVRKQIELFEARTEDVESNAKGRNKPIVLGQVGIRCRHCRLLSPKSRSRGATYYPARLNGLYQAAQSMASGHLCYHCEHIPAVIRQELLVLRERKSSAGGGKKYWGDGVRILGVFEDESGLRFNR